MAAFSCKHFQSTFPLFRSSGIRCQSTRLQSNVYKFPSSRYTRRWLEGCSLFSRYSPKFQPPIFQKDQVEEFVKEKDPKELKTISVKAAESNRTCSIFYDDDVETFTNLVMRKGRKELARSLVSVAFTLVKHQQLRKYFAEIDEEKKKAIVISPREIFHLAVKNVTPVMKVRKVRKGGVNYQVPVSIHPDTAKKQAMRWIIDASKDKAKNHRFHIVLSNELIAAASKDGKAYKKKLELHKLCEVNKGYAHLRKS